LRNHAFDKSDGPTVLSRPAFLAAEDHYVWAYHVRIENGGGETVQLRNRHWRITDALGRLQEVRGPASSARSRC